MNALADILGKLGITFATDFDAYFPFSEVWDNVLPIIIVLCWIKITSLGLKALNFKVA